MSKTQRPLFSTFKKQCLPQELGGPNFGNKLGRWNHKYDVQRHARRIELTTLQTETLFHTYSQFASVPNIPAKPSEDERDTESKLQEILEKVSFLLSN